MSYREFREWCNQRACDGCWGMHEAMICIDICGEIQKLPFWKRKKKWREYERDVVTLIVEPTNAKIREATEVQHAEID